MKARVRLREKRKSVDIRLSPHTKRVGSELSNKWESSLELIAKLYNVPSVMIMKLSDEELEVFAKNSSSENPYEHNERCKLGKGVYCETVIGDDKELLVHDASGDAVWNDSPAMSKGMIHYFGLPLKWSSGEMFGTICIMDSKSRRHGDKDKKLLYAFRDNIEKDLSLLEKNIHMERNLEDIRRNQDLIIEHEKNRLTNQLVSSITHEISTPIGVALTTASYMDYIIKTGNQDSYEKLQEGANLVHRNLNQASKMLKTFTQVSEGSGLVYSWIHMKPFMDSVILSLKYDLKKHNVMTKVDASEDILVKLPLQAMVQVMMNLIINATLHAFKDVENKWIEIKAVIDDHRLLLSISDNGNGITDAQRERIFEPFVRFDNETDGSGLGLYIVRDLVENTLKGKIECISDENGTSFEMDIPVEVNHEKY